MNVETVVKYCVVRLCLHDFDDARHVVDIEIIGFELEHTMDEKRVGGLFKLHRCTLFVGDDAETYRFLCVVGLQVGSGKPKLGVDLGEASQSHKNQQYK